MGLDPGTSLITARNIIINIIRQSSEWIYHENCNKNNRRLKSILMTNYKEYTMPNVSWLTLLNVIISSISVYKIMLGKVPFFGAKWYIHYAEFVHISIITVACWLSLVLCGFFWRSVALERRSPYEIKYKILFKNT